MIPILALLLVFALSLLLVRIGTITLFMTGVLKVRDNYRVVELPAEPDS